jgi:hypothetical protein
MRFELLIVCEEMMQMRKGGGFLIEFSKSRVSLENLEEDATPEINSGKPNYTVFSQGTTTK